jgi:hypothetical protein
MYHPSVYCRHCHHTYENVQRCPVCHQPLTPLSSLERLLPLPSLQHALSFLAPPSIAPFAKASHFASHIVNDPFRESLIRFSVSKGLKRNFVESLSIDILKKLYAQFPYPLIPHFVTTDGGGMVLLKSLQGDWYFKGSEHYAGYLGLKNISKPLTRFASLPLQDLPPIKDIALPPKCSIYMDFFLVSQDGKEVYGAGSHFLSLQRLPVDLLPDERIVQIGVGKRYSAVLTSEGKVHVRGRVAEEAAQLRDFTPAVFPAGVRIKQISCGEYVILAVDQDGCLYLRGDHQRGCFSHYRSELLRNQFTFLQNGLPVSAVCVGGWGEISEENYAFVLLAEGRLLVTGRNFEGVLGLPGARYSRLAEERDIAGGNRIVEVQTGWNRTIIRNSEGQLYTTGKNTAGGLGLGHTREMRAFTRIPNLEGVRIIAFKIAGPHLTFALSEAGQLYVKDFSRPDFHVMDWQDFYRQHLSPLLPHACPHENQQWVKTGWFSKQTLCLDCGIAL